MKKSTLKKDEKNYLLHNFKTKGITLIALVVTIIVLLILSGVSINLLVGKERTIRKDNNSFGRNAFCSRRR